MWWIMSACRTIVCLRGSQSKLQILHIIWSSFSFKRSIVLRFEYFFSVAIMGNLFLMIRCNGLWKKCGYVTGFGFLTFTIGKFIKSFGLWFTHGTLSENLGSIKGKKLINWKVVSNILALFYGILAVDKDLLDHYLDDFQLIGFERHSKVYGLKIISVKSS